MRECTPAVHFSQKLMIFSLQCHRWKWFWIFQLAKVHRIVRHTREQNVGQCNVFLFQEDISYRVCVCVSVNVCGSNVCLCGCAYRPSSEDICVCDMEVKGTSRKQALCPTVTHHQKPSQKSRAERWGAQKWRKRARKRERRRNRDWFHQATLREQAKLFQKLILAKDQVCLQHSNLMLQYCFSFVWWSDNEAIWTLLAPNNSKESPRNATRSSKRVVVGRVLCKPHKINSLNSQGIMGMRGWMFTSDRQQFLMLGKLSTKKWG